MARGRAARLRKRRKIRNNQQSSLSISEKSETNTCAHLRKWMVSISSKAQLAGTFELVPYCFPGTGRGLKTKTVINPGTVIISCPQCLLLTPSVVLNTHIGSLLKRWTTRFTPHQLLALFLVVEQNKGTTSKWHPFISSLPTEYTLPHYLSNEELVALPTHVYLTAEKLLQRFRHAHRQVLSFCSAHWENADSLMSLHRFCWAWCSVSSRSVFLETEGGTELFLNLEERDENNVALCPYLDLLNHTSTARTRAGLNRETGNYEIVTEDTYQPHEQVFISYGPHDNRTLFLQYGFTLPHNMENSVCFSVDDFSLLRTSFQVSCWDQKQDILRKHRLHRNLTCTMEGVSWNFLSALKILSMDWDQLQKSEKAVTGQVLSPAVESCARCMAKHLIRHTIEKHENHLAEIPGGEDLSLHMSIARDLVMDELRILRVALQDVS